MQILLYSAFVPGTNDRVFEDTDAELLFDLPFTEELKAIGDVYTGFSGGQVADAVKK